MNGTQAQFIKTKSRVLTSIMITEKDKKRGRRRYHMKTRCIRRLVPLQVRSRKSNGKKKSSLSNFLPLDVKLTQSLALHLSALCSKFGTKKKLLPAAGRFRRGQADRDNVWPWDGLCFPKFRRSPSPHLGESVAEFSHSSDTVCKMPSLI
jgi:hypothetical protein